MNFSGQAIESTLVGPPLFSRTEALSQGALAKGFGDAEPTREMEILPRGIIVGGTDFRIEKFLASGGMGDVYQVSRGDEDRHFALKLLRSVHGARRDLAERMEHEGRVLQAAEHEHLVRLLESGCIDDGRPYLLMELLSGCDLRMELGRIRVFSVVSALSLMEQALDGLSALHQAGFVHRDVKLQNLFLCDGGTLKVLDVGIAREVSEGPVRTGYGVWVGTSRAMAPEQHTGGPVDARTDVYGVGLALYELIAGRGPFDDVRGNDRAMRFAHCIRRVPSLSALAPQAIPAQLEAIVQKALAKRPDDRFSSAQDMADALRKLRHSLMDKAYGVPSLRRRMYQFQTELSSRARGLAGVGIGRMCRWAGIHVETGF